MRRIDVHHVNPVANSETQLNADCQVGDTTIQVKNGSGFTVNSLPAFNPLPDYADLPNFTVNPRIYVKELRPLEDGASELVLSEAIGQDAKAGTAIRAHRKGSPYLYAVAFAHRLPNEWTALSGTLTGSAPGDVRKTWYPGTRFAAPGNFLQRQKTPQLDRVPQHTI